MQTFEGGHLRSAEVSQQREESCAAPGIEQARARGHAGGIECDTEKWQAHLLHVGGPVLSTRPPKLTLNRCITHKRYS